MENKFAIGKTKNGQEIKFENKETINASCNELIYLDVSECEGLINLDCSCNDLINLDLSKNLRLEKLDCSGNKIKDLDLSKNYSLEILYCNNNELNKLDISNNIRLTELRCGNDYLTKLDFSKNLNLKKCFLYDNFLKKICLGENMEVEFIALNSTGDSLYNIQIETAVEEKLYKHPCYTCKHAQAHSDKGFYLCIYKKPYRVINLTNKLNDCEYQNLINK